MMQKAGIVSFYGPCVFTEFAENVAMHEYTRKYINAVLFNPTDELEISPSEIMSEIDCENKSFRILEPAVL